MLRKNNRGNYGIYIALVALLLNENNIIMFSLCRSISSITNLGMKSIYTER